MGFLATLNTTIATPRFRAMTSTEYAQAFWNGEDLPAMWPGLIGDNVDPELALTLSYVYCAVSTISDDFGTSTCQMFEDLGNDGRARVKYSAPGIGSLARMLRWQPNFWQTSKAFWSTMAWQYLLRPAAYAEIVYTPGSGSFVDQLVPRHPDRVQQEVLPREIRYRLLEPDGRSRVLTQDEMLVVRNTSSDGLNALSRIAYGSQAILLGLALQSFTRNYFKKGATAALLATYAGDKDDEDEADLHASISRYMGADNAGGVLLVPDDIKVSSLGVDPEKSELLGLKNLSGRDIARLFKMPPSWLGIEGSQSYNSQVQDAQNYVNRCQVPMAVEFEQAIQRDLILAVDRFFAKFNLDYLLRADLLARAQAYEILIRSRVIRPSEARVREDYSPDAKLDQLSEGDFRPGTSSSSRPSSTGRPDARSGLRAALSAYDSSVRCVRRERAAVEKLAKRYASDVAGWQAGLREFYEEHAGFVARTMRVSIETARMYAAQHGSVFETKGVLPIDGENGDHWEREESEALCMLALEGDLDRAA